jgi:type II secretory pathway pseudopilin PulG
MRLRGSKKRRQKGALLIDALIGVMILGISAAAFYSTFPVIRRAHLIAKEESQAAQVGARLVEHLQMLTIEDLNFETLHELNLASYVTSTGAYAVSDIPMDDASLYSARNVLNNGRGWFYVHELENESRHIDLTIAWQSSSGKWKQVHTGTIIGGFK